MKSFPESVLTILAGAPGCLLVRYEEPSQDASDAQGSLRGLSFHLDCSDTFTWGSSDCEQITPENFHVLARAAHDVAAFDAHYLVGDLFTARVRRMRPQNAFYNAYCGDRPQLSALFDACGKDRAVDANNPLFRKMFPGSANELLISDDDFYEEDEDSSKIARMAQMTFEGRTAEPRIVFEEEGEPSFLEEVLRIFALGGKLDALDELHWTVDQEGVHLFVVTYSEHTDDSKRRHEVQSFHSITEDDLSLLRQARAQVLSRGDDHGVAQEFLLIKNV